MTDSYIVQSGEVIQSFIVQSGVVSIEAEPPPVVDMVLVQGPQGPTGAEATIRVEVLAADGTTGEFQLEQRAASDLSVQVFRNGLAEIAGVGFTTSSDGDSTIVSFSSVPLADDEVQVVYLI